MRNRFHPYLSIIKDYFIDFVRGFKTDVLGLLLPSLGIGVIWGNPVTANGFQTNWLAGIPVLFALVSGALHRLTLPFMMYLVPCSQKQREEYIHRMLKVKIGIPLLFALLCDLAALCLNSISCYVFVLQMVSIFFITCLCGMLNDGRLYVTEGEKAYGGMWCSVSILLMLCYIGGTVMFLICADSVDPDAVSAVEFRIILSVMTLILLPMTIGVGRRWKQIRHSFADYETAMALDWIPDKADSRWKYANYH